MIPRDDSKRNIESNLPGETSTFTIKASGKAFKVLIDGLYSNKIRSIIRELWTNAFDAHVAAGKRDVPFECGLPSHLSPEFFVRDFGTSMTHEMIMSRYSTLFDSTKDETNEQVGYLGLGSKSPFSYTDSFTLTAWLDGEKRVYSAVLNTDGVPSITLLGRSPSDEPQGLRVSFSASPSDSGAFRREAAHVAIGFDVPPACAEVRPERPVHSGTGWKLFENLPVNDRHLIRQGCVVYPYSTPTSTQIPPYMYLVVDVPVGTCEVTASRESLSLNPETERAVKAVIAQATTDIHAYFEKKLAEAPSLLAASKLWYKEEMQWLKNATWKGQSLLQSVKLPTPLPKCVPGNVEYHGPHAGVTEHVRVTSVDALRIVVDDGTPIVRRRVRITQFAGGRSRDGSNLNLLATPAQAKAVKAALELADAQFVHITDLPDPGPKPRSVTPTKSLLPTTPFVWATRSRESYTFPSFNIKDSRETGGDIAHRLRHVLRNELKVDDPVHFFTPKQVERLGLSEANRLDHVVAQGLRGMAKAIKAQHDSDLLAGVQERLFHSLGYSMPESIRRAIVEETTGPWVKPTRQVHQFIMELAESLKLVGGLPVDDKVNDIIKQVRAEYPLLFSTEKLAKFYFDSVKNSKQTAAATSN